VRSKHGSVYSIGKLARFMAQRDRGTSTPEYQLFQTNYSALSSGIGQAVETVAERCLEKGLISAGNLAKAKNREKTELERASDLALLLIGRVEQRAKDFYLILDVLKSIQTLSNLVELLEPGQASRHCTEQTSGNSTGQATGHPPVQASGNPAKLSERPSNKDAFLALLPIASEWPNIGLLLDLPPGRLDSIGKENGKDRDKLREMVAEWLRTLGATWRALITAVKQLDEQRALEIERKLCS
jgi:hypothetical protein